MCTGYWQASLQASVCKMMAHLMSTSCLFCAVCMMLCSSYSHSSDSSIHKGCFARMLTGCMFTLCNKSVVGMIMHVMAWTSACISAAVATCLVYCTSIRDELLWWRGVAGIAVLLNLMLQTHRWLCPYELLLGDSEAHWEIKTQQDHSVACKRC